MIDWRNVEVGDIVEDRVKADEWHSSVLIVTFIGTLFVSFSSPRYSDEYPHVTLSFGELDQDYKNWTVRSSVRNIKKMKAALGL